MHLQLGDIYDVFQTRAPAAVAVMGDRLSTIDMGRKLGGVPLWGGGAEPI